MIVAQLNSSSDNARCLIALEFGGNFGHLTCCLAIARQLRAQGCEVLFAVPDSSTAHSLLASEAFAFVQAPRVRGRSQKRGSPISYADLLLQKGFVDTEALSAGVQSWCNTFALFRPNILLCNFSPTAMLAGRVCGLNTAVIGSGFFIPPQVSPFPSIRPWDDVALEKRQAADDALLGALNRVLRQWRRPILQTASELFKDAIRIISTFAELDHYGVRPAAEYAGVFYELSSGCRVDWPQGDGKRVLVYLRPEVPGFGAVLQCLRDSPHRTVFAAPGIHPENLSRLASDNLHLVASPVALDQLLKTADLAISYGSLGFVTQTLRSGLPQLMLPTYVEQAMYSRKVAELGAGIMLDRQRNESVCALTITKLLEARHYGDAAQRFAKKHAHYDAKAVTADLARQLIRKATFVAANAATVMTKGVP